MSEIEVRYVEVDLPPIQVGLVAHVRADNGDCMAGIITMLTWAGEAYITEMPGPGRTIPYRDRPYRFEPGGQNPGTFHRLGECPQLSAIRGGAVTTAVLNVGR